MHHWSHDQGVLHPGGVCLGGSAWGVCIQGGLHPGGLDRAPPPPILRDTVNEPAVRILLECILIGFVFALAA